MTEPAATQPPRRRAHWWLAALASLVCMLQMGLRELPDDPSYADSGEFLGYAHNLAEYGVYAKTVTKPDPAPEVGREPAWPLLLSIAMRTIPPFTAFTPDCLKPDKPCRDLYRVPALINGALFGMAGLFCFAAAWMLTGSALGAWVAGGHIWLNIYGQSNMNYVVSDPLAVCLAALAGLCILLTVRRRRLVWALATGLALGSLILTKAMFLLYIPAMLAILLLGAAVLRDGRIARLTFAAAVAVAVVIGPWMLRNQAVSGDFRLTDDRGGIALSTRVALNDMTPAQIPIGMVYWTRGFGDDLAATLWPDGDWRPFDFFTEGGFYDIGQYGYGRRVNEIAEDQGIPRLQAQAIEDQRLIDAVLENPAWHAVTTVPVFYRGIWSDEFIALSLPALFWLTIVWPRRRRWELLLVLTPGWFNLMAYALLTLNIPRYQLTALPTLAIASGIAAVALWSWYRTRKARRASSA